MRWYYVYIMSNKHRTVLYTGVTNSIIRRSSQHALGEGGIFASKYNCNELLYFEEYNDIRYAIAREKQLKNWKREWKLALIKTVNPKLRNLLGDC
jgi:putative endonuclease